MFRIANFLRGALARSRDLVSSSVGNVSIMFALCIIPIIGLLGLGIDYGIALTDKTRLDNAADAAAIAAVATAKAYVAANSSDPNVYSNAIAAGKTRAAGAFAVNSSSIPFATIGQTQITLSKSGATFTATVSYSASCQNNFGQIFGRPTFNLSGNTSAVADITKYLDFYLLIDVTGSVGLPSTPSGQTQLASLNHDGFDDFQQGCMFACHYGFSSGWSIATDPKNNIQLRSGAVNSAVCSFLQQAANPLVPNQYRVGLYPFINTMAALTPSGVWQATLGAGLTADIKSLSSVAQCSQQMPMTFTNLLDTGDFNSPMGAGGTHFDLIMPQMQTTIVTYGDGSLPATPKPFVFLITDGMQNSMTYTAVVGFGAGSKPAPLDPNVCNALKAAGATISILYIPYLIINFVPNGGINSSESTKVNAFSPTLPTPLRACASPGFFYQANSPADITAALNSMFSQAIQVAHLTQ